MVDISQLITEYGKYYINAGQGRDRLKGVPFLPCKTLNIPGMIQLNTKETIHRLANPMFAKVLQQFQKNFTAKGGVEFHPNEIQLRQCKVDDQLYPHDIEESWLGWLAGDSSRNIEDWPIVKWLFEVYYAQQIAEEKETDVAYKGVYAAPTAGTAGSGSYMFDGFHKLLQDGADDSDYPINVINNIGALDADTAFDQIEAFSKGIATQFTNHNILIFVAPAFERAYLEGKREKGYYNITKDGEIGTRIDFTHHTVMGLESMAGTTDIWATMPGNMYHLMKRGDGVSNFDVQKADRLVKVLMDWWEAVGFGVNKLVWASAETVA